MYLKPTLQWLTVKHLPQLELLEIDSFNYPWSRKDFLHHLRNKHSRGFGLFDGNSLIGFVIFSIIGPGLVRIHNMAVAEDCQGMGYGTFLMQELLARLPSSTRDILLITEIPDYADKAIAFFCKLGFKASEVLHKYYDEIESDVYRFEIKLEQVSAQVRSNCGRT